MKKGRYGVFSIILIVTLILSVGCGAKKDVAYEMKSQNTVDTSVQEEAETAVVGNSFSESKTKGDGESVAGNRKLIKRVNLGVETLEFDQLIASLTSKVNLLGGYMESSEMSGNTYLRENNSRYANMIVRIPSDRLDEFVITVKDLGNVTRTEESTEDITLQYVDTESHKEALIIEQERLLEILKEAKKLEDIIKLEERLSQVRYEVGSYESQLRSYDNLVDYSTVTLSIQEVQHITPVQDETAFDRMNSGLGNTFFQIKTDSINFAVWFVTNLPYLIMWAIILTVVGLIIKKRYKGKRIQQIMQNTPTVGHNHSSSEHKEEK